MMNRQLLLLTAFLFAGLNAFAQTFQFQYQGVALEDGATVTIVAQEDFFGELSCETNPWDNPANGLVLKMQDLSAGDVQAVLQIQNNGLGASMMQWCMGGECSMALNKTSLTKTFAPNGTIQVLFDATNIQGNGNLLATSTETQKNQTRRVGILFTNEDATGIAEVKNERMKAAIEREESGARFNSSEREQARPQVKSEKSDNAVYDLSGCKLNSKFKIINSKLPKGIYVINGKKVIR